MGLKPGDTLSSWLNCSEAAESFIVHLACQKAGLQILALSSERDLEKALSVSRALVFSPWTDCNGSPRIDSVLEKVPSLLQTPSGSLPPSSHTTKYFIQSGFRTIRGTYKLKSIPIYNSFPNPVGKITFSQQNHVLKHEDFQKYLKDFTEKIATPGQNVVNSAKSNSIFGFANIAAALESGVTSISSILTDPVQTSKKQQAQVLLITEEKIKLISEKHDFEKIVLGVDKKEDAERLAKLLEQKGVRAKQFLAFQAENLSLLS